MKFNNSYIFTNSKNISDIVVVMSYPKIKDKNFQNSINKKYKKYTVPKKKRTFNQICFPKDFQLQIPQLFLGNYIHPSTPYKGVLVFHRIGAGKTCTAVNIGEMWKGVRKIVVVVPASLRGNFRDELRSQCAGNSYLTKDERKQLSLLHPSSKEFKKIVKESDKRIDKYYTIMSYNKFIEKASDRDLNLNNSILIVDEVQNMVSEDGIYYKMMYDAIHNAPSSLRVVLLSATPMFDKPVEIALTMNLLRIPIELPTGTEFDKMFTSCKNKQCVAKNLDMFKSMIKGHISYFRGAPPYTFPDYTIKYVNCDMSKFQYSSYKTVSKKEGSKLSTKTQTVENLPNNFFLGTRIISNVSFPNSKINQAGLESFKGKYLNMDNLKIYSTKFHSIMLKLKRSSGPVFIYSNFRSYGGIESFVRVLDAHGYSNYSKYGEGRKRYAIWSGDESDSIKQEIKNVFNQKSNYNGSKIRIVLGSPSIKEGVSLFQVSQVHILEPYWNQSRLEQIIGRAIRYCSHKNLPEEKRNVKVYIYIATHPSEKQTIDQYIKKLAFKKNRLIKEFELAMKEAAVDCELFKEANVYKGEDDIKCGFS